MSKEPNPASGEGVPFKIRLSLKGDYPKNATKNHVVTIAAPMTLQELQSTSCQLFGVNAKSHGVELYSGFPPKMITAGTAEVTATSVPPLLVNSVIRGGDNVIVKFIEIETAIHTNNKKGRGKKRSLPPAITATATDSNSNSNSSTGQKRNQRAAAKIASSNFKTVIKEQDEILKKEQTTATRNINTSTKKKTRNNAGITTRKTNAIESTSPSRASAAAAANSRRLAKLPGGRRLDDDTSPSTASAYTVTADTASSPSSIKTKKVMSIFQNIKSEDDISFALLSSVNNPGSGKKISKVLRSAMRRTVEKSYEASRAVVRCSAIVSRDVSFIPTRTCISMMTTTGRSEGTCNDLGSFTVRYPKGVEGMGYYEDENIHIISIEMLKAVIHSVFVADQEDEIDVTDNDRSVDTGSSNGKEMLRPTHMAQLSPRVFWSLWFHFREKCTSIEESLELLLPELDWRFLSSRSRQLSQKAKENMRQKQVANGIWEDKKIDCKNHISHLEAVKSVEEAMEKMYEDTGACTGTGSSIRALTAQAALSRFANAKSNKAEPKWILETPTEFDNDELIECIEEAISIENLSLSSELVSSIANILSSNCSINNWRMLANATTEDILPQLHQPLQQHTSNNISNNAVDEAFVNAIITAAQQRSVEEIMLEILDGNESIFVTLREDASAATPMDMSLWHSAPSILLEEAPVLHSEELGVTVEKIVEWSERSTIALNNCPWLEIFSTSISNS